MLRTKPLQRPITRSRKEKELVTITILDNRLALAAFMMMPPPSFSLLLLLLLRPSSGFQVPPLPNRHHHSTSTTRPIINRPWMIPRIMRLKVEEDGDDQEEDTREEPSSRGRPITPPKFTGAGGSSPLFSQDSAPRNKNDSNNNNPYEREINLASAFEQTLGLQALGLLAALVFVLYVGFTGGITDGSDRYNYGEDDILMMPVEEVMKDGESSQSVFL